MRLLIFEREVKPSEMERERDKRETDRREYVL